MLSRILLGIIIGVFIVTFPPVGSIPLIGILFLFMRVRESEITDKLSKTSPEDEAEKELAGLALLHLELTRLHQAEQIDSSQYDRLNRQLIKRYTHLCNRQWSNREERRKHLESAWFILEQDTGQTLGPPPWQSPAQKQSPAKEVTPDKDDAPQQTAVEFVPVPETTPPATEKTTAKTAEHISEQNVPSVSKKTIVEKSPPSHSPPKPLLHTSTVETKVRTSPTPPEKTATPKKHQPAPVAESAQPISTKIAPPE
ncbi:MAG: hypothetical protein D3910_15550, partial [Candidatus Electrothrix sp. ATG2]|nr:hypothetical protein [Candidatus Electrothrix sp. ATG2]